MSNQKTKPTIAQQQMAKDEEYRQLRNAPKEIQELRERMLMLAYTMLTGDYQYIKQDELPSLRKIRDTATELEKHILNRTCHTF